MTALAVDDLILDRSAYGERRADERARMIALRHDRRVQLGESLALEFETPETLRYQVQEMLYVEGISDAAQAQSEIDTYTRLLPDDTSLVATMLVELEDQSTVRTQLQRWRGLQHHIALDVNGQRATAEEIPGPAQTRPSDVTESVHFLRFRLTSEQREAVRSGTGSARVVADHPEYHASAPLPTGL